MLLIQPTEEMSKQIRVELNEDVSTRQGDMKIIKEWLAKQPHLPNFDGEYTTNVYVDISFRSRRRRVDVNSDSFVSVHRRSKTNDIFARMQILA